MTRRTLTIIAAGVVIGVVGLWLLFEAVWRSALHNRGW